MKRTQIYIDDEQDRRLEKRARATGKSKSQLIREAIDRLLSRERPSSDLKVALKETAGSMPDMAVPDRDEWNRGYG